MIRNMALITLAMISGISISNATELIKQYQTISHHIEGDQTNIMQSKSLVGSPLAVIDYAELGVGVMPLDNALAAVNCIELPKDDEVSFGVSEGSLSLKFIKEEQELAQELNINSTIKGNYGLLSGSLQASYLSSQQNKSNALRLTFLSKTYRKVRLNSRVKLNQDGQMYRQTPQLFAKRCGSSLVVGQSLGSYLLASINIDMESSVAMSEFKSQLNISYATFVDALMSVKAASKNLGLKTSISITIKQVGGNPSSINSILNKAGVKDGFLYCNADNMDKCIGVANAIMEYIADDKATTGYSYQLQQIDKAKTYSQLKSAGAVNIGLPSEIDSSSIVEDAKAPEYFDEKSKKLFDLYNAQASIYSAAQSLSNLTEDGSDLRRILTHFKEIAKTNMTTIEHNLNQCMGESGFDHCNADVKLAAYDKSSLSALELFKHVGVLKNNFKQYALYPWTSLLPSNQSWIVAVKNSVDQADASAQKRVLLSGDFGTQSNYIYQGIAPVAKLGKRYDNQDFYAQNADEFNFNGHYYYLTFDQLSQDGLQFEAPSLGINGLPTKSATVYLWDPYNTYGYGGLLSFNYHYIKNNSDYQDIIEHIVS